MNLKIRYLMFIACIAVIMAVLVGINAQNSFSDFPLSSVNCVSGKLIYDSTFSKSGNRIMKIRLEKVYNVYGNSGQGKGIVTVVSKGKTLIPCGTKIVSEGSFSDNLFISSKVVVSEKHKVQVIRERIINSFEQRLAGSEQDNGSMLCMALLLGRTEDFELQLQNGARNCGCLHVLALSGMHLRIIASIFKALFGKKKTGKAVSFIFVSLFVFTAGPRPSLVRAYLMYLLSFLPVSENLAVSFLVHIIIFPYQVSDLGFIYGYAAMAGLVFLGPYISGVVSVFSPKRIASSAGNTVSALILTCPIQLSTEGQWHFCSILVAPIASFLAELSMAGGLLTLIIGRNSLTVGFNNLVYSVLEKVFLFFENFPEGSYFSYSLLLACVLVLSVGSHFIKRVI